MSRVLFSNPGKLGDALFRLPVAYQHAVQFREPVDVALDHGSRPLIHLLRREPWTDQVFLADGIQHYGNGGQPFDFGRPEPEDWAGWGTDYDEVYHLGYRGVPANNLTLWAYRESGTPIDPRPLLSESPITQMSPFRSTRYLCLHLDSSRDHLCENTRRRNDEARATILPVFGQLQERFERVYLLGRDLHPDEYRDFLLYPKANVEIFRDDGDFAKVADLFADSLLVGTYSSMWALAAITKTPQVVIMDPEHYETWRISSPAVERLVGTGESQAVLEQVLDLLP